jgi:GT2 family glycosyltransferase
MNARSGPLVSICMPGYNVETTLTHAVESVFRQTYDNIEVILVDDGSTDATEAIARTFKDRRFRYERNKKNMGGFQTMNKAISLATGEFVAVYHTDDIYGTDIVAKEAAYLEDHPEAGAVFCLSRFMDQDGRIYGNMTLPAVFKGRPTLTYDEVFPFLLRNKNILFCCPTFMARRTALESVGPFDAVNYDVAADLDMWIRILRRYPVGVIDEPLMSYRHSKSQWSSRYNKLRTTPELYFSIMDHYLEVDGWRARLSAGDLTEYAFHRQDDDTKRAGNQVILGNYEGAMNLVRTPFPWRTLLTNLRRRKFRVLLMHAAIVAGLAVGAGRLLARLLLLTEYGGRL